MTALLDEIWQYLGQATLYITTAGVIFYGCSNYFGKLFADRFMELKKAELNVELEKIKSELNRTSETHRIRLQKSQMLFEIEVEAASKFVALRRKILPKYQGSDMDWHDVLEYIASQFNDIEADFAEFLSKFGAVLTDDVVELVSNCIGLAGRNKENTSATYISIEATNAAQELYEKASLAESRMLGSFRAQIEK